MVFVKADWHAIIIQCDSNDFPMFVKWNISVTGRACEFEHLDIPHLA